MRSFEHGHRRVVSSFEDAVLEGHASSESGCRSCARARFSCIA